MTVSIQVLGDWDMMESTGNILKRIFNNSQTKDTDDDKSVKMLHGVTLQKWTQWIQTQNSITNDIRVIVDVIGVDMVLDNMLMDPINHTTTNPVLRVTETVMKRVRMDGQAEGIVKNLQSVNDGILGDGTMIGIVLNVHSNPSKAETQSHGEIPSVELIGMHVDF